MRLWQKVNTALVATITLAFVLVADWGDNDPPWWVSVALLVVAFWTLDAWSDVFEQLDERWKIKHADRGDAS